MINLPKTMDDFDYFVESPFAIFEKKNFLDIKFYNELRNSFRDFLQKFRLGSFARIALKKVK